MFGIANPDWQILYMIIQGETRGLKNQSWSLFMSNSLYDYSRRKNVVLKISLGVCLCQTLYSIIIIKHKKLSQTHPDVYVS